MSFTKTTVVESGAADEHPDGDEWIFRGPRRDSMAPKVRVMNMIPKEARSNGWGEGPRGRFEITVKFTPEGQS